MAGWKDLLGTLQSNFKIGKLATISAASVLTARTFTFPNASGQLALKNQFGLPTLTNDLVATTEVIVTSWPIIANAFAANDSYDLQLNGQVSSIATLTFRIRFGTTGTAADALLATFTTSAAGAANAYQYLQATISFLTATTATANGISSLNGVSVGVAMAAFTAATVNLTVANFLTVSVVQSLAQTYTSRSAKLSV